MEHDSLETLRARHQQLVGESPNLRIRERALRLGVPEAALVAAGCGVTAQELAGPAQTLFRELGTLGRVMALSRNGSAVHERHGAYLDIQADGPVGIVLGPDIDLRMFFASWKYFYAVTENGRRSIQFFDMRGEAVHKVYRTEHTDGTAWDAFVARFATATRTPVVAQALAEPDEADVPDDAARLRAHWRGLTDTHDFFGMLRQFKCRALARCAEVAPASQPPGSLGHWLDGFLFSQAGPIYAGTNEIQRNIVAERRCSACRARNGTNGIPGKHHGFHFHRRAGTVCRGNPALPDDRDAPELTRELWATESGRSDALWRQLADQGMTALMVPQEQGGLGLGEVEWAPLAQACGYFALPEPLLDTALVAAGLLRDALPAAPHASARERCATLLERIASGNARVAVAHPQERLVADAHVADASCARTKRGASAAAGPGRADTARRARSFAPLVRTGLDA